MLPTLVSKPFHRENWVYEEKYDGYRILAYKEGGKVSLRSRNDNDRTKNYVEIAAAVGKLRARTLLLDGEVVAFDSHHVSRFQLLQGAGTSASYVVFDLLYKEGRDLRSKPLVERRSELEATIREGRGLPLSRRLAKDGLKAYQLAKKKGFEGLVAKDLSAPYVEGRTTRWLKVKVHQEDEFVVVGYTAPAGSRQHFGALLLGAYKAKKLYYVGKVGTGFTRERLAKLARMFRPLIRKSPTVVNPPGETKITYLQPRLVAQIAYEEWTADRKLRQPVFLGLRDDKKAEDVELPPKGN
jgi:bifunctional non-homologous end joining protein LigD